MLKDILPLLLGWLLGILSPAIVSHISNNYKKKYLKKIIISELNDIKYRLANIPLLVYPGYGMLDEEIFNWVKIQTNNFASLTNDTNESDELKEKLGQLDDLQFIKNVISSFNLAKQKPNPGFGFKKITLNFIDSNIINLALLEDEFVRKILDIKFNINSLNEEMQRIYDYMLLTFDGDITPENHQIISLEIKNSNLFIAKRAILIVDKINLAIK